MKIFVHDLGGYAFISQLSRALPQRGYDVVHSTCDSYVSGKGELSDVNGVHFVSVGRKVARRQGYGARLLQELWFGVGVIRQLNKAKPDVVLLANAPIPTLLVAVAWLKTHRTPWVLWHQDVHDAALRDFARSGVSAPFRIAARGFALGERWAARSATAIVAIDESFRGVHERWGTSDKVTVIPNWAPTDEVVPGQRNNAWGREQALSSSPTVMYAGTLGLKHHSALLVDLVAGVRSGGVPAELVVVTEGQAVGVLREAAARLDVPLRILPFQDHKRLPEVLASGDILVVILEAAASAFSVPSKTWTYLCAGRPILGLMPQANQAAKVLAEGAGAVFESGRSGVQPAAEWAADVLRDPEAGSAMGLRAREIAETRFDIDRIATLFDGVLRRSLPMRRGSTSVRSIPQA